MRLTLTVGQDLQRAVQLIEPSAERSAQAHQLSCCMLVYHAWLCLVDGWQDGLPVSAITNGLIPAATKVAGPDPFM